MTPHRLEPQGGEIERWWLVFTPPVEPGWWRVFLTPGFGHVYGFRQPQSGVLIALNPLIHRVENAIVLERASDLIARALDAGHKVLVVERCIRVYNPHTDVRVGRGLFLTCASYLAYTIGISFSWRSTPWHLYKAALKAGAVEIERRQDDLHRSPEAQEGQRAGAPA